MGVCVVQVNEGEGCGGKGMKHVVKECVERKDVYDAGEEAR